MAKPAARSAAKLGGMTLGIAFAVAALAVAYLAGSYIEHLQGRRRRRPRYRRTRRRARAA